MGQLFAQHDHRRQSEKPGACLKIPRLLLFLFLVFAATGTAKAEEEDFSNAESLQPNVTISKSLKPREKRLYKIDLTPGQYCHVVVDQKGIDLVVKLFDANRGLVIQRDSPNSKFGPEQGSLVAQFAGPHYVEISSSERELNGGYELRLEGPRQATAVDERRIIAEQAYFQGSKISEQRDPASLERAIEYYQEAANIWRELNDFNEEGYALSTIGELYRALRRFDDSERTLQAALTKLRAVSDVPGQAYALNSLGATYRELSPDPLKAVPKYEEALALRRTINDRWGEAQLHNNIGFVYLKQGNNRAAAQSLTLAYDLWRALNVRDPQLNTLNNLATSNLALGQLSLAYAQFKEVLESCRPNTVCRLEPYVRNSLGTIFDTWGEPTKAIAEYRQALALYSKLNVDTRSETATVFDNLGLLYLALDDIPSALDQLEDALKLRLEMKSPGQEAVTRSNLGYAYLIAGNYSEALKQLDRALELSESTNIRFKGHTLLRLGLVHFKQDHVDQAFSRYFQALTILTEIGDVKGQARALNAIAALYSSINQFGNARRDFRRARAYWKEVGDLNGEALSLYGLAQVDRQTGNLAEARQEIAEAISRVESPLSGISNYRFRRTFFESRHNFYELETEIRMQSYLAFEKLKDSTNARTEMEAALFAAERGRSRNILDFLNEAQTNIRQNVDSTLLAKEETQKHQIEEKLDQLQSLTDKERETRKAPLLRELNALKFSLDQTRAEIRLASPKYAALTQPQILNASQMQALINDDTCILQYALGDQRSYLWAITRKNIYPFELPGRDEVEKAARALIEDIKLYESDKKQEDIRANLLKRQEARVTSPRRALDLGNLLLKPLTLRGPLTGIKRIVIVADGELNYLPFSVLPLPTETNAKAVATGQSFLPLISSYELVYEPSASVLALMRRDPRRAAADSVAVFADPVFSKADPRVLGGERESIVNAIVQEDAQYLQVMRDGGDIGSFGGSLRLLRLKNSRKEAEAIVAVAPPGSTMVALDFDANRMTAQSEVLKQYKIVHFATHGIYSGNPELSGLVFSLVDKQGRPTRGFLRLNDIYNLNLPVELVVLSACETAIGEKLRSEGLIGLTRGFMYAGSARVVASLWKVDDAATAELMKRFYANMLEKKMTPAQALRQAQLEIPKLKEEWRNSYYWAGFVLQGEWQ